MIRVPVLVSLAAVLCVTAGVLADAQCTRDKVRQCSSDASKGADWRRPETKFLSLPDLNKTCTIEYPHAKACIDKLHCSVSDQAMKDEWNNLNDIAAYLCGGAKAEFIENFDCYKNASHNITACESRYNEVTVRPPTGVVSKDVTTAAGKMPQDPNCKLHNERLVCLYKSVKEHCDEDGGEVFGTLYHKIAYEKLDHNRFSCDLKDPTPHGAAVTSYQLSALLLSAAVLAATLLV